MRSARVARVLAGLVLAGCCSATAAVRADPAPAPTPAPAPAPAPVPTPAPVPKTVIDHDGYYAVGTDIEPGTYRSDGPVAGQVCYWKRVQGDQIIDNTLSKKPQVVQIEPTDTVFKTDRCQPWRKFDCQADCPAAHPPPPPPGLPDQLRDFLNHPPPAPAPGGGR